MVMAIRVVMVMAMAMVIAITEGRGNACFYICGIMMMVIVMMTVIEKVINDFNTSKC